MVYGSIETANYTNNDLPSNWNIPVNMGKGKCKRVHDERETESKNWRH